MNRSVLIRIATPTPARIASTVNNIRIPADDIETTDAALYLGGGMVIGGLDHLEQLINGIADRIDIIVSGVTPQTQALALSEADDVKGATIDIGVVFFDGAFQVSSVQWMAQYRADKLSIDRTPTSSGKAPDRTISLSMGSDDTGRSRSPNAYFTDADQRRRSSTDAFFSHVAGINQGTSRLFGPNQ